MGLVLLASALLVIATTLLHYEALRLVSIGLPRLRIPSRAKLMAAVFGAFASHSMQIALYGLAFWMLARFGGAGALATPRATPAGLPELLYFSAETYTSLGYGDFVPGGPLRALAGVEALNGLLLIGWTASYLYVEMQRFWTGAQGG